MFDRTFPGLDIYINSISDRDESFEGVMISDARDPQNPQTIFANRGRLISDEQALRVILRLEDGVSHPKYTTVMNSKYQLVEFPALDILLSLQSAESTVANIPLTDREMGITQLWQQYLINWQKDQQMQLPDTPPPSSPPDYSGNPILAVGWIMQRLIVDSVITPGRFSASYLVELHKRFSIPFACLVFGLIGTPLGIQSRRAGKSGGYAISVVLLLIYYIFITAGENLGDTGRLPVLLAVWTPNLLLGGVGLWLLTRVARR